MTKKTTQRDSLPMLNRRDALYGIAGCGLAITSLNGCVVSRIYGELSDAEIDFDINSEKYQALGKIGGMVADEAGGWKLVLIRRSTDEIIALDRICPHAGCEMSPEKDGQWESDKDRLVCTCHFSYFKADGSRIAGPTQSGVRAFPVEFDSKKGLGQVNIRLGEPSSGGAPSQGGRPSEGGSPAAGGVQNTAAELRFRTSESGFAPLANEGGMVAINEGELKILLIRTDSQTVIALDRICPHEDCDMAPLGSTTPDDTPGLGKWENNELICVCHDSRFGPDGRLLKGPATVGIAAYAVQFDPDSGEGLVTLSTQTNSGGQ